MTVNRLLLCLVTGALLVKIGSAQGTVTFTQSGTWPASEAGSSLTGPNESWSYAITFKNPPTVYGVDYDGAADFFVSGSSVVAFAYSLNGLVVTTAQLRSPLFFNESQGGGFQFEIYQPTDGALLTFNTGKGVTGSGDLQLYSGSETAPTLLPGNYPLLTLITGGAGMGGTAQTVIVTASSSTLSISGLSPGQATLRGQTFTLTVNGSGFLAGATVQWNGSPLPTTYISGSQLQASVSANLIATAGVANVSVMNPGGALSNSVALPISPPLDFTTALRIAQIVDGGGWKTQFAIQNLDVVPVNFAMQFWGDDGRALPFPIVSAAPGVLSGTLATNAVFFAESSGTAAQSTQGWAEVASSGRIGVFALFRYSAPGVPDSQGTVDAAASGSNIFMPYDNTQGYRAGLAVANTNPNEALTISLEFLTDAGTTSTGSLTLLPHAHTAFVLATMFPATADSRGSIHFTASSPDISVLGLRFTPSLSFTSIEAFQ